VGVDAALYTKPQWDSLSAALQSTGKSLVASKGNLVDEVWDEHGRPPCLETVIENLALEFSGRETKDKLADVREQMKDVDASVLVVAELHEVACKILTLM